MRKPRFAALALCSLVAACTGDDDDDGGLGPRVFTGSAQGTHPTRDLSAECSFDLFLDDWEQTPENFTMTVSGEVFRTLTVGSNGGQFQALVGGPGYVEEIAPNALFVLFGDQEGAPPFWTDIEILTGAIDGERLYSGTLDCSPLNTQFAPGVVDSTLTVSGTWSIIEPD